MSDARMRNVRPKNRLPAPARTTSVITALAFYFSLGAPYAVRAQEAPAPVVSVELTDGDDESAAEREAWSEQGEPAPEEGAEVPETAEEERPIAERALPSGEAKSAVTPQAISLPKAEGSIEGMGESFTPSLSAGTATFSVPIALPKGRAGVQPSLELTYGTSAGNGAVGIGWSISVPYIARQTDKGLPRYAESVDGLWHEQEDTFLYNGGQELVPVDSARATEVDGAPVPAELAGWQQYRARVEGGFMRFFRSPDGERWVVQDKGGSRFDFGVLPEGQGPSDAVIASHDSLMRDDEDGGTRVFSWGLTRMSDPHGSTIYYQYLVDQGQRYLSDIYYVSPASCGASTAVAQRDCAASLDEYGRRVRLVYEHREDAFDSYVTTWRVTTGWRLKRIEVTAFEADAGERTLVRRYHLDYDPSSFLSLVRQLVLEGRPEATSARTQMPVGDRHYPESALGDEIVGATLPPMRFSYTQPAATTAGVDGFAGISALAHESASSPAHSMDEARTDLFDVNSDGLPDIIVTDPARYRTADDEPAVGVFFNGFSGTNNTASRAGEFSSAIPVSVPLGYAQVMHLGNLNVAPMDIDGDGRSDLLHMPRTREYSYFTPVRAADGAIPAASPAAQGYRFTRVPVELPNGAIDPRIDLGRDGRFIKTLDVDNDSLIDIVQSTGTGLLTWLNLGRYPGGDGLFGSATWTGREWLLSPAPLDSCLLQEGLPVDFEDSQLRLGDMNADGLQDIVKIRQGRVLYWPGRGPGLWGVGPATCSRGEGEGREIDMFDAPEELNAELDGVFLADLNHDGADDVVQVRFDAVDVWWNRAGHGFSRRITARGTPYAPSFASTIRFADIDGSGTTDIVYGRGGALQWIDPMGGQKPRLLQTVENGLGGVTEIEYGSSAQDYLRDLAAAETCADSSCERFTWSFVRGECDQKIESASGECARRSGSSPVISTVVRASVSRDQLHLLGREETASRTEYLYHDGYYEGIEQEFRGFGAADTIARGEAGHPTSTTRTRFHQGRRPTDIASDRLADNPDEALKGRELVTESFDSNGTYLSTQFALYTVRELLRGLNDVAVSYAFVHRTDELRYDNAPFAPLFGTHVPDPLNSGSLEYEVVRREVAGSSLDAYAPASGVAAEVASRLLRSNRYAHLSSTVEVVDNAGNQRRATAHGRVRGELGEPIGSEAIVSHTVPVRVDPDDDGAWLWRNTESYTTGHGDESQQLGRTLNTFAANGDLLVSEQPVTIGSSVPAFVFGGDTQGAQGYPFELEAAVSSTWYDSWGNALRSCAGADISLTGDPVPGCLRFVEVAYDSGHQQFVVSESTASSGPISALQSLTTQAVWDQGQDAPLEITDANQLASEIEYDGHGRLSSVSHPDVRACAGTDVPTTRVAYELAPLGAPINIATTYSEMSCASIGASALITRKFIDGYARDRATLVAAEDPADPAVASRVQRRDVSTLYAKGTTRSVYQSDIIDAPILSIDALQAVSLPATPSSLVLYDAFSRPVVTFAEDLSSRRTRYHALSQDVWDALDQDASSPHYGTPTTTRADGHGRVVDNILRNRRAAGSALETYRLTTGYRADGSIVSMRRAQTTDDRASGTDIVVADHTVSRTFFYDSLGRRIGSTDPDTDAPGAPAGQRSWRYLFNRVDDLVAVRDPRGCGQNFFYDRGGRLIGEDYVRCAEAQVSGETHVATLPPGSIALDDGATAQVDVRYYFDSYPDWLTNGEGFDLPPIDMTRSRGRATGTIDRGQRSVAAYDDRGHVVWQARQMAVIPSADSIALTLADPPTVDTADAISLRAPVFDPTAYTVETSHDHGGRTRSMRLPVDPDYAGTAPLVGGSIDYNARGLPARMAVRIDSTVHPIIERVDYTRDGLVDTVLYGDALEGERTPTVSTTFYDVRRRPERSFTIREATAAPNQDPVVGRPLGAVTVVADQRFSWDASDNLVAIHDLRDPREWPNGFRPASYTVQHDSLYRVTNVEYDYTRDDGARVATDSYVDYRAELASVEASDPMRARPAPRVSGAPAGRVASLTFDYDWLANTVEWTDDAAQFYERSIGRISNGPIASGDRPAALRLASDLPTTTHAINTAIDRGGYAEVDYGVSGNLTALTVHAQCRDRSSAACFDPSGGTLASRRTALRANCSCAVEQHYQYRWDEVNRLVDARRYDRAGTGTWSLAARQRYRYDASNQRAVKQVMDITSDVIGEVDITPSAERVALYVYAGDFERRGLVRTAGSPSTYDASSTWQTESQYVVAGARVVARSASEATPGVLERDLRATIAIADLVQSTTGVIDLFSGALVETSNYYPNGARESYRAPDTTGDAIAAEPAGFTGKEADDEVGVAYFGQRYLVPRLGRWASPDPLSVHAAGGGEVGNPYHYVSGNILQTRDPIGLCGDHSFGAWVSCSGPFAPVGWLVDTVFGGSARLAQESQERVQKYTGNPALAATVGAGTAVLGVFGADAAPELANAADDVRSAGVGGGRGWRLALAALGTNLGSKVASKTVGAAGDTMLAGWRRVAEVGQWGGHGKVSRGSAADTLRRNMEESTGPSKVGKPTTNRAHHVIPVTLNDHAVLKAAGFEMNNAANGILLDKRYHSGGHEEYTEAVEAGLDKIAQKYDLENLTGVQLESLRKDIVDLQERAVEALGDMYPSLKREGLSGGALRDAWNEAINGAPADKE